jgi:hypothetical protein
MGIDAALVIAIVVGGMAGDRHTSAQIGRIAGQPGAELHGAK